MSNPEFPNSSASSSETQTTGEVIDQTPNVVKEERGEKAIGNYNRFSHLSKDELLAIEVADLSSEEIPAYIAATKKIIAANGNKQLATQEQEMMAVKEAENTAAREERPSEETEKTITAETTTTESTETTGTAEVVGSAEPIETAEEAEKTEPADKESVESIPNIPHISVEEVQEDIEQSKKQHRIRNFFSNISKKPVKAVIATLSAIGIIAAGAAIASSMNSHNADNDMLEQDPRQEMSRTLDEEDVLMGEIQEHHGIYDGYGEKGMFNSENKGTPYDFANAAEVAEEVGNDECDIMKAVDSNQVESFADHLANFSDEVKAKYGVSSQFNGISIMETEHILEGLSDNEYDKIQQQKNQIWDDAFTENITINGEYHNSYMRLIDPSKPATHDNIELVECVTYENNTKATRFYWTDDGTANGKVIGSMIVKITRGEDNKTIIGGCTQVVNSIDITTNLYEGMTVIDLDTGNEGDENTVNKENEDTGNEGNEDNGNEEDEDSGDEEKGWGKKGDPNSGPNRQPSDLVDPDSEVSEEENDATNQGNQGYVDDNQATPGSASENNGTNEDGFSKVIADGADTEGGRLSGGEQQGGGEVNGTNPNAPTPEQTARDDAGNAAQEAVQDAGNTPGGDNNSNAAEEAAVAGGNF